jgi:DNA-binding transcriptional ArsR family regulator
MDMQQRLTPPTPNSIAPNNPAPSNPAPSNVDNVFAALANPARRDILRLLLNEGQQPVQQIASHFDMRRPSISEHLKVLRDAGLVRERKRGRQRYYQLEAAPLMELQRWLSPYEQFWREKLANLRQLLDEQLLDEEKEDQHE